MILLGLDSSGLVMAQLGRAQISLAMVPIVFRVIAMTGALLDLAWLWRRLDAIGLAWMLGVQLYHLYHRSERLDWLSSVWLGLDSSSYWATLGWTTDMTGCCLVWLDCGAAWMQLAWLGCWEFGFTTAQKGLTWIPVVWQWKRPA